MLPNLSLLDIGGGKRSSDEREEKDVSRGKKKKALPTPDPSIQGATHNQVVQSEPDISVYNMVYAREALAYGLYLLKTKNKVEEDAFETMLKGIGEKEGELNLNQFNKQYVLDFKGNLYGGLTKIHTESDGLAISTESLYDTLRYTFDEREKLLELPLYQMVGLDNFVSYTNPSNTIPSRPQGLIYKLFGIHHQMERYEMQIVNNDPSGYIYRSDDLGGPADLRRPVPVAMDEYLVVNALRRCYAACTGNTSQIGITEFYIESALHCLELLDSGLMPCFPRPKKIPNEKRIVKPCILDLKFYVDRAQDGVKIDPTFFVLAT